MSARRVVAFALAFGLTAPGAAAVAQDATAAQLLVTAATPDPDGRALKIAGRNFGPHPFVTLDLYPIALQSATDSEIVATVPTALMPPGIYLLTVSRGPSATEIGSLQVTVGGGRTNPDTTTDRPDLGTLGPAGSEPAAKVGDRVITVDDVDREWRRTDPGGYLSLSRQLYENRRRATDALVTNELLAREAARRGLTVQALLAEEIPARTVTMPESAVLSLYEGLGDRARGVPLEQMRPALRAWLERVTQPELAKMNYVEELMKVSTRADVFLAAPRVRVDRAPQDAEIGPATAAVEIVAFGDLQSPEYARFALVFAKVRDTFGDKVRLVFKHLPLLGPESVTAGEAAACANAQGKFWAFHDAAVVRPVPLRLDRLKNVADAVGVDRRAFDACLDGGTFTEAIRRAAGEAERYAVRSSPSFLVNGSLAPPPPPFLPAFEFLKRLIEDALLQQARASSKDR
ncbi:MAG: thioredoxin domain-containing protein [Acidobacteria bacterium]|nr:thioredoxin domain-containing protein [Acidobacteriota bacterium]